MSRIAPANHLDAMLVKGPAVDLRGEKKNARNKQFEQGEGKGREHTRVQTLIPA